METKNQKFQELVKKMDALKESEKGLLRGGISVMSSSEQMGIGNGDQNNSICKCIIIKK